jgi:plasmid stabilization system protein ParE
MSKLVIWSEYAVNDFENILEYLNLKWGNSVVNSFIDKTDSYIAQISMTPDLFPIIHKSRKIRRCVLTKHNSLYYRFKKDRIDILRIYDNRQNPQTLKFKV